MFSLPVDFTAIHALARFLLNAERAGRRPKQTGRARLFNIMPGA